MTTPSAGRARDPAATLAYLRHDSIDDALGGDGETAVVQDRAEPRLVDRGLERKQSAQLRIAVLLHDEHDLVPLEEVIDLTAEREGTDAHVVHPDPARLQD